MVNSKELSENELNTLIIHAGLERLKVKINFKEIMYEKYKDEYTEKDNEFFEQYAGKIVYAYPFNRCHREDDWFILNENNHCLTSECFETTHNSSYAK